MASRISLGELRDAMSCDVCMEEYDEASKKPMVLPCGHTFCRPCLNTISVSGQVQCPTCRAQHNVQVESLTVNYALLNITPLSNDMEDSECATHKDNLRYFCWTCWLPMCGLCLHSGHPQDHNVILTEAAVHMEKIKLLGEIKTIFRNLKHEKVELRADFSALHLWMQELFRRNANMHNTDAVLNGLLDKIQKANDIPSLKGLEKEVEQEKNKMSPSNTKIAEITKHSRDVVKKKNSNTSLVRNQSCAQPSKTAKKSSCKRTQARGALMDFRDGRLLLHSLAKSNSKGLSLQMPSEVFLELSVGDRHLGCVYIKLWSQMRLAQQFLALCMGTMGPSLLGIKAQTKMKDIIVFRSDDGRTSQENLSNAETITTPLLTNLEWGGIYERPATEGYIMRAYFSDGLPFGICTEDQNIILMAPFGKVVAGLDAVRNAFLHNPLTEVTVTNCGLALTGLSLVK